MTDRHLAAVWLLSIAMLGGVVVSHSVQGTTAYFTDSKPGSITGSIATPTPTLKVNLPAAVRIEPQAINVNDDGEITGFVESLPAPHALSEIDLASLQLCYKGACIPSEERAKPNGKAQVAAKFDRAALARIVGTDSGDLALVVQGKLIAGGTFSGSHMNRVTGSQPQAADPPAGAAASDGTPTPTPDVTATPRPAPTSTPDATPTPDLVSTPAPTATAVPTTTPTPDSMPTSAPTLEVTPAP